jgi:hypothetical protein
LLCPHRATKEKRSFPESNEEKLTLADVEVDLALPSVGPDEPEYVERSLPWYMSTCTNESLGSSSRGGGAGGFLARAAAARSGLDMDAMLVRYGRLSLDGDRRAGAGGPASDADLVDWGVPGAPSFSRETPAVMRVVWFESISDAKSCELMRRICEELGCLSVAAMARQPRRER